MQSLPRELVQWIGLHYSSSIFDIGRWRSICKLWNHSLSDSKFVLRWATFRLGFNERLLREWLEEQVRYQVFEGAAGTPEEIERERMDWLMNTFGVSNVMQLLLFSSSELLVVIQTSNV